MLLFLSAISQDRSEQKHTGLSAESADFLTQIYQKYKSPMWRYSYKILKDEALADDVVQTTFQKMIEKIDLIQSLNCNKLNAYIVIMVRNLSYTVYRQRKRQNHLDIGLFLETLPDVEESPEETVLRFCDYEDILSAKDQLHTSYKDLLTMKFVYQYNDEEIAKVMGIKPASVRVVTHRALKALRKAYLENHIQESSL